MEKRLIRLPVVERNSFEPININIKENSTPLLHFRAQSVMCIRLKELPLKAGKEKI